MDNRSKEARSKTIFPARTRNRKKPYANIFSARAFDTERMLLNSLENRILFSPNIGLQYLLTAAFGMGIKAASGL